MRRKLFFLLSLLTGGIGLIFASSLTVLFSFSPDEFLLNKKDGFVQVVGVSGGVPWGNPGEPQIWAVAKQVLLPPGSQARSIRIVDVRFETIAEDVVLFPSQKPAVFYAGDPGVTEPNKELYCSDVWFPESSAILSAGTGSLSGFSIADIIVFPLRYNPLLKKLEIVSNITIDIDICPRNDLDLPLRRSSRSLEIFSGIIGEIVSNPTDINLYQNIFTVDDNLPDVAIVLPSNSFAPSQVERLRLLLNRYAWQETLIYLNSLPPIGDNAQRIRTAIRNLWLSSGIAGVILVGDTEYLQHRVAFAMDCEYGAFPDENYIPCDLYFSDLDGTWNADGDGIYGEVSDSVDLYPDVLVGRISVSAVEMQGWIGKRVVYGENPPANFSEKFLFLGSVLWDLPFTDAGVGKDMIRDESLPEWADLTRLYETLGNENRENVISHLNDGYHIINHDGHAFTTVMGLGEGDYLFTSDASYLSNFPKCGIVFSIGCWPAAFDYDCIAEKFLENPNGGAVAFIGNSRYGWGSPGNPGFGYSDYFDREFYKWILHKTHLLGYAVAGIKASFIPYARWENVWRWKVYEINLLGDPTQIVWQGEPEEFSFEIPASIPYEGGYITFASDTLCISVIQNGVLLSKECGGGTISFFVDPITSAPVEVVITDPLGKKKPFVDTMSVSEGGPYLSVESLSPTLVNCCFETTNVCVTIRNAGSLGSFTIADIVSDTGVNIVSFSPTYFEISAGSSQNVSLSLINHYIENGKPIDVTLRVASINDTFHLAFRLITSAPAPLVDSFRFVGDTSLIEPGNTYCAYFFIRNSGTLGDTFLVWFESDENFFVPSDTTIAGLMPSATITCSREVTVLPGASAGLSNLYVRLASRRVSLTIPLYVPILMERFFDDAEAEPKMILNPPWHITEESSHSGGHSYKCGPEGGMYEPYTYASMRTPPMVLGHNAVFEFWTQYDVPTYGTTGIHIIVHPVGLPSETLAFIGSGGALGHLNFFMGWNKWRFELPPEFVGEQVWFEIVFRADENQAIGFYLDDISVSWTSPSIEMSVKERSREIANPTLYVSPNPFNLACVFASDNNMSKIEIFDLYGILVDVIYLSSCNTYKWLPNKFIKSGVFLARISFDNGEIVTRKIVLLK